MLNKLQIVCKAEWERILAGIGTAGLLLALLLSGLTAASWLKSSKPTPVRDVAARTAYGDHAFAFLTKESPSSTLNSDHAFSVKPPAGWRQGEVVQPPVQSPTTQPDRTIAMSDLLDQLRRAIPSSLRSAKIVKPVVEPEPIVKPKPPKVTPPKQRPPPPPPRYVTYQGIIRTAEGREMALLTVENTADGSKKASYATAGTRIADGALRILGFNDKGIRCRTATGAVLTVPYGGKQQIR